MNFVANQRKIKIIVAKKEKRVLRNYVIVNVVYVKHTNLVGKKERGLRQRKIIIFQNCRK